MTDYGIKKRLPDYTELAYKEAVNRLRFFLSESYAPSSRSSKVGAPSIKNLDESGDEGYDVLSKTKYPISFYGGLRSYNPVFLPPSNVVTKRYPFYPRENFRSNTDATLPLHISTHDANITTNPDPVSNPKFQSNDPELMGFIQKQEEYIEQLERESSYCRDELNNLLGKVKEVISENESLHDKQKNQLLSSVMDHRSGMSESDDNDGDSTGLDSDAKYTTVKKKSSLKPSSRLEGPNIVFESKISELEAQLTQSNINLKKMQEENNEMRRKMTEGIVDSPCLDSFKRQIENLQRDKSVLEAQVDRLKSSLDDKKDCDSDLASKIKRSSDIAYQANYDKTQLEMEIRRLKEELERQQARVRELLGEQTRRVMEERSAIERRYCSQVEQLTSDLTTHWDSATKLQMELERQKREESELKRELVQKNSQIEDLKLELKNKIASLQADVSQAHADRSAVEEELANARLILERHQRQSKHDANRLNSEVQSVRQRLDRADADLVHSRRENLRLMEQLANMEKEMNLRSLRPASPKEKEAPREKELSSMLMNMENKHGLSDSRIGQSDPTRTERASSKSKELQLEVVPSLRPPVVGSVSDSSNKADRCIAVGATKSDHTNSQILNFPLYIKSPFLPEKKEPIKLDISVKVVPKPRTKSDKKERKKSKHSHSEKDAIVDAPMEE
ncbi:serologically defined colon cancer antigen 8 homolog isoform X2 [Arctopsyche grandis]